MITDGVIVSVTKVKKFWFFFKHMGFDPRQVPALKEFLRDAYLRVDPERM